MKRQSPRRGSAVWALLGLFFFLAVCVFAAGTLGRSQYPDGSFWEQSRTILVASHNPELEAGVDALRPGETTVADFQKRFGRPDEVLEGDIVNLWIFSMSVETRTERAILGWFPSGERTDKNQLVVPIGVQEGRVVHTFGQPSRVSGIRVQFNEHWNAYNARLARGP